MGNMFHFAPNLHDLQQTSFCTQENFASAVTYLSKELEIIGYSPLIANGHDKLDIICLVNTSYDLLQTVKECRRSKRETEESTHKLISDLQHCQWLLSRQKELGEKREREVADALEKQRQSAVQLRKTEGLLKKCREENQQLLYECNHKQNQFQHALRRRDIENSRLQEQLLKLIQCKSTRTTTSNAPAEIEIKGSLNHPNLAGTSHSCSRRKWDRVDDARKIRPIEEKWRLALHSAEKEHQKWQTEYSQLVMKIWTFLTKFTPLFSPFTQEDITKTIAVRDLTQLPVSVIQTKMDVLFQELTDMLTVKFNEMDEREQQMKLLREEIQQLYCSLQQISQQLRDKEAILLKYKSGIADRDSLLLSDPAEEKHPLGQHQPFLEQQITSLEQERRQYIEGFIQLTVERAAFEEDKMVALKDYFSSKNQSYFTFTPWKRIHLPTATEQNVIPVHPPSQEDENIISSSSVIDEESEASIPKSPDPEDIVIAAEQLEKSVQFSEPVDSSRSFLEEKPTAGLNHLESSTTDWTCHQEKSYVSSSSSPGSSCSSSEQSDSQSAGLVREGTVIFSKTSPHSASSKKTEQETDQVQMKTQTKMRKSNDKVKATPTTFQRLQLAELGEIVDTPFPSACNSRRGSDSSSSSPDEMTDEQFFQEWITHHQHHSTKMPSSSHPSHSRTSLSVSSNSSTSISAKVSIVQQAASGSAAEDSGSSGVSCSYTVTNLP